MSHMSYVLSCLWRIFVVSLAQREAHAAAVVHTLFTHTQMQHSMPFKVRATSSTSWLISLNFQVIFQVKHTRTLTSKYA